MTKFDIAFDNGGGATLMTANNNYVHHYDDMDQLAYDVQQLLGGASTTGWENNEPEFAIDDNDDGYKWYSAADINDILSANDLSTSWRNVRGFFRALGVNVSLKF
jgi:hypothetical protein